MSEFLTVYLDVAEVDEVKLVFNFAMSSVVRSWDFKIALLPCSANYLGMQNLYFFPMFKRQYFTGKMHVCVCFF